MNKSMFDREYKKNYAVLFRFFTTIERVSFGASGIGILIWGSSIASILPYIYVNDERANCGARLLIGHSIFSLLIYSLISVFTWLVLYVLSPVNDRISNNVYKRNWKVAIFTYFIVMYGIYASIANDIIFVENFPVLSKELPDLKECFRIGKATFSWFPWH